MDPTWQPWSTAKQSNSQVLVGTLAQDVQGSTLRGWVSNRDGDDNAELLANQKKEVTEIERF
jgi:hypothetical protein